MKNHIESEIKERVMQAISELVKEKGERFLLDLDSPLIGGKSILDSMSLVELCVQLEDIATEIGFEFDWTSDVAMSPSKSMFRNAGSLADEFYNQLVSRK